MDEDEVIIYSYRDVFRTRWVVYRLFDIRWPMPGGLPMVTAGWFVLGLIVVWLVDWVPVLGDGVGLIPAAFRYPVAAVALTLLATQATADERTPRQRAMARARLAARRKARKAPCARAVAIPVHCDGSTTTVQRGRVCGPAVVHFNAPVRFAERRRGLVATADPDGETGPVLLSPGTHLEVRR